MAKKYIDAEKLIAEIERQNVDKKVIEPLIRIIDSLQQEQSIQVNTLTWKDINDLERIINNVHYEFRSGIGEKSFGEEVLERFKEERDEQEQPEVDLEEEIAVYLRTFSSSFENGIEYTKNIARHFYELGQREMRHRITNPEYNAKVVEQLKSEYPAMKEE